MNDFDTRAARRIDVPTVVAITLVCGVASSIVHEAVGHGLAALTLGAHVRQVSSIYLDYDERTLSNGANCIVDAAGPLMNLVAGGASLGMLAAAVSAAASIRYALWLFSTINLFEGFGYFAALAFAPFGDVHDIAVRLPGTLGWEIGFTLFGIAGYLLVIFNATRLLAPMLSAGNPRGDARRLALLPYMTYGITNTLAAIFNPLGPQLIFLSAAAATFGGTAGLISVTFAAARRARGTGGIELRRSSPWLVAGGLALLVLFVALAPGLPR
jgi:hypothetical protein